MSKAASFILARDDLSQPYSTEEIESLTKRQLDHSNQDSSSWTSLVAKDEPYGSIQYIEKRRGGGGRSGGISSSGGSSSSSGGSRSSGVSSSSSGTSASKGFTPGSVSGGRSVYGSSSGLGIPNRYTVSSGAFAGRSAGGGTRPNVVGGPYYGSGYTPGYASRGFLAGGAVGALGFPFIFWPVTFGGAYGGYYGSREYDNGDRPGGNVTQYTLTPPSTVSNATGNAFALYGDANSVDTVFQSLVSSCGVSSTLAANFSTNPNQAVQYYRGSSFAILLNGYNNTQPLVTSDASGNTTSDDYSATPPALTGVDTNYFNCLNSTTRDNVPLIESNGANGSIVHSSQALMILISVFVAMIANVFM